MSQPSTLVALPKPVVMERCEWEYEYIPVDADWRDDFYYTWISDVNGMEVRACEYLVCEKSPLEEALEPFEDIVEDVFDEIEDIVEDIGEEAGE